MKSTHRPTAISTILETVASEPDTDKLERYIAELEAKQPDRRNEIRAILSSIGSRYTVDLQAALEAYISHLEANQQTAAQLKALPLFPNPNNPPVWSQQRTAERDHHRRERAMLKQMIINDEKHGSRES